MSVSPCTCDGRGLCLMCVLVNFTLELLLGTQTGGVDRRTGSPVLFGVTPPLCASGASV